MLLHTIINLIGLSPFLINEDDGHEDDDLSNNPEEGPQSSQATAHTQVDFVRVRADFIGSSTDVVSNVRLDVQIIDGQHRLVGGALYLVSVTGAVANQLRVKLELVLQSQH